MFVYPWGVLYESYPRHEKYCNFTSRAAPDLNPACKLNSCALFLLYPEVEGNISVLELKGNIWREIPAIPREECYV